MSLQNWDKIKEIYFAADELAPGDERERYLAEVCEEDEELRRAVEKLLGHEEAAENLMSRPLMDVSGVHVFAEMIDNANPLIGRQIGAYRLEKEIGRGGMGAVYLAERADGSFRQQVAVKLVKRGMDTDFILRRFRQERQILASLNHPNIARLLDGGTTADDLPFFVMEFVEGKPLYKYSDERKLSINERLKLFRRICEAIDFAHRNEVIHRDIKPPNILVTKDGTPKLLDFGIAKVLNPEIGISTIDPTATAMRLMTPEYASPEQVCGSAVTPASDIYSLGVLLYELLTGHRPYRFRNRAPHEIARVICEEEPDRPSTGITREDNLLPTAASEATTLSDVYLFRGATNIEDLQKELAGDIERVILKCLRKEPTERYQTAAALADDIDRYLEKRPVRAESFAPEIKKSETSLSAAASDAKESIAVLPFKMFGANTGGLKDTDGDEFLGIGLADALVTRLSSVPRIVVRPTSSVLGFGASDDPFAAGQKLAVKFVIDGNIRQAGGRVRITVQLLNVNDAATVWAQTFDEEFTDVLAVEDSISERVAESLVPKLTGSENERLQKRGTNSPEAYEAYLRGRFYWNQFTPESLFKARESFETALALDADYALAHVGIGDFYTWANIYGLIPSLPALAEAERHARRAVEIDEHLGEAYATLGQIAHTRRQWAASEKLKLRSIKLNPNYVNAREWRAAQLVSSGRTDEGVEEMKRAESLDPLSLRIKTLTSWTLYQAHHFDEALEKAKQIIELDKNYPQGYSQIGLTLWAMRRYNEALPHFEKFNRMIPDSAMPKYQICFALASVNREPEARKALNELKTLAARGYVKPYFLAMAHVAVGDADAAFEYFEQSFNEYEPWLLWFGTEPMLESLYADPRFVRFLGRMNNPIAERFKKISDRAASEMREKMPPFTF
jgi:serine/threonine protein kinase/Flp pilus assembly protein TadD